MQWDDSENAGFSDVKPWLPVHVNASGVNVLTESSDDSSLLHMHRQLLKLRQELPVLRSGSLEFFDTGNGYVLAFKRELDGARAYVLVNYADSAQSVVLPETAVLLASSQRAADESEYPSIELGGYEAVLLVVR